ncbi:VanW family protein [Brevibacillus ruminantium]|uniref:VanW family protein n=1 Tax=Brevibacillus ruminantium TaxID=2950604 RepID=A0ABY4WBJ9_9BACL|nr:VanW family protein [Brevibacillus ruminantium]USG64428.1 VanW family protein [Brevibacillus ruminantium]
MGFSFWLALLILGQTPLDATDFLRITWKGNPLAYVDRADYTLPFSGVPLVDEARLDEVRKTIEKKVYKPPVNAIINEQGQIIPEQRGRALDRQVFWGQVYEYFYGNGPAEISPVVREIWPRVDRALLQEVRKRQIGYYTTYFNPNNYNRSYNISLATKSINNYVVLPGETFSFNKVVGQRTREKGYLDAPIIVKGELSEGIGGGICQVSSTLFNAVDQAGLHIIKRYSHSRHVPYVPPGRDATVSWWGPDFVFQNRYAHPILIRAHSGHGRMMVTIHSFPEIEYEPRSVPSVQSELPEETPSDSIDPHANAVPPLP